MASSSSITSATSLLQLQIRRVSSQPRVCNFKCGNSSWRRVVVLWACPSCLRTGSQGISRWNVFLARSSSTASTNSTAELRVASGGINSPKEGGEHAILGNALSRMQGAIGSFPPVIFVMKVNNGTKFAAAFFLAFAFLVIFVRETILKKPRHSQHGSVADLVKRGQLKSHRRGITKPLKYEDPFNNPLVKVGKNNSTVEMCGKVYHLAPVTLTEEQQSSHQKRRSRAYKWKRPTIFLKEGDAVPTDVDLDTVRWIPANHPFATTVSDIDEELAQNNVYQKNGVPFRIKAEHEALQRKLEALQSEQKLNRVAINPSNIQVFERSSKSFPDMHDEMEPRVAAEQQYGQVTNPKSDRASGQANGNVSEEWHKS